MSTAKSRARNAVIQSFDVCLNAVRAYIETWDSDERLRLGVEPALRDVRRRFELATMEES